jgi:hypothetical protein
MNEDDYIFVMGTFPLTAAERDFFQIGQGLNLDTPILHKLIYWQRIGAVNLNNLFDVVES